MNYSNTLSIVIISMFFATISAQAMETTQKRLTIAERRQRGLTEEQEEQGKIKATDTNVNTKELKEFQKQQKKQKKYQWNCCK